MMSRMLKDHMTRKLKVGAGARAMMPRMLVRSRCRRTMLRRCFVIGIDGDVNGDNSWAVLPLSGRFGGGMTEPPAG